MESTAGDGKGVNLEKLGEFCKLVTSFKGHLEFIPKNLDLILASIKSVVDEDGKNCNYWELPAAVIAVIGPEESGKSLLTNFLIHFYESHGQGWFEKVAKKDRQQQQPIHGFSWDSVEESPSSVISPDRVSSGIYLWPQPFMVSQGGGRKLLVWIMHIHHVREVATKEDLESLEQFLALACSRLTEIIWRNAELRLVKIRQELTSHEDVIPPEEICDSIVYLIRSKEKPPSKKILTDREELCQLIMAGYKDLSVDDASTLLEGFKFVSKTWIKDIDSHLQDEKGMLIFENVKSINLILKNAVTAITEENEVQPKTVGDGLLTLGNMKSYLDSCVNRINQRKFKALKEPVQRVQTTGDSQGNLNVTIQMDKQLAEFEGSPSQSQSQSMSSSSHVGGCIPDIPDTPLPEENDEEFADEKNTQEDRVRVRRSASDNTVSSEQPEIKLCKGHVYTVEHRTEQQQVALKRQSMTKDELEREMKIKEVSSIFVGNGEATCNQNEGSKRAEWFLTEQSKVHGAVQKSNQFQTWINPETADKEKEDADIKHNLENKGNTLQTEYFKCDRLEGHGHKRKDQEGVDNSGSRKTSRDALMPSISTTPPVETTTKYQQSTSYTLCQEPVLHEDQSGNVMKMEVDDQEQNEQNKDFGQMEGSNIQQSETASTESMDFEEDSAAKAAEQMQKEKELEEVKEKEKREKEEQLRIMEDNLPVGFRQVTEILESYLKRFIQNELNIWNVAELENIYPTVLNEVLRDYNAVVNSSLLPEFAQRLNQQTDMHRCFIQTVHSVVEKFASGIKKKFELYGFFSETKLNKFCEEEKKKVNKEVAVDQTLALFVNPACQKLMNIYKDHNQLIIRCEKEIAGIALLQTKNFYNDEMKRFLKENVFSPDKLEAVSKELVSRCVAAFEKAFKSSTGNASEAVDEEKEELRMLLIEDFQSHKQANGFKLMRMQAEINKITTKLKSQYVEKMEELLQKNLDGMSIRVLQKHHEATTNELKKLLEMEVRGVRAEEPIEAHWKCLQTHIDKYWPCVMDGNQKNIAKMKEREEEAKKEQKKREAEEKLQKQKEEADTRSKMEARKPTVSCSSITNDNVDNGSRFKVSKSSSSSSRQNQRTTSSKLAKQLPPLAFHMTVDRIKMGIMEEGKPNIIKNDCGEDVTPALVGLTMDHNLIYGTDVLSRLDESGSANETLEKRWLIGEFFEMRDEGWNEEIFVKNGRHEITLEFLLGFLLRKLKDCVERQLDGICESCVIAIPFYFPSTQRIRVKHAALIAGFFDVYLVNEIAAAAFACALCPLRSTSAEKIIVLSKNSRHFDAAVYSYNGCQRKVKMMSHCADYSLESKEKNVVTKVFQAGLSYVRRNILLWGGNKDVSSSEAVHSEYESMIRKVCKRAVEKSQNPKLVPINEISKPNEVIILCEEEEWRPVLEKVGSDLAKRAGGVNENNLVVEGVVLLCERPKEIGERVKDQLAYDVLRSCGTDIAKVVMLKSEALPVNNKKCCTDLPSGKDEASFYQMVMDSYNVIGDISVNRVKASEQVQVCLDLNFEGIVTLKYVTCSTTHKYDTRTPSYYLSDNQYFWNTHNLSEERLLKLSSLLESLQSQQNEENELSISKKDLSKKCEELVRLIETGEIKFRSDLGKGMALKQITDAQNFASHQNACAADIEKHASIVTKLESKYLNK